MTRRNFTYRLNNKKCWRTYRLLTQAYLSVEQPTQWDADMNPVQQVITDGWPLTNDETPMTLHAYCDVRDELTVQLY